MKVINNILKENNIIASSYKKNGSVIICDTNIGKIVIKKNSNKNYIYKYLSNRSFNYFPEIINSNSEYVITKYIDNINIPDEQKVNDLTDLLSLLHSKTTHYKIVTEDDYKKPEYRLFVYPEMTHVKHSICLRAKKCRNLTKQMILPHWPSGWPAT